MSKQSTNQVAAKDQPKEEESSDADEVRGDITEHMHDRDDAADIALAAVDELADRAAELEAMKQELDATREQLLRNAAEFQNYRRRTEAEKSQFIDIGKMLVIQQLLDVLDDLGRSLDAAQQADEQEHDSGKAYKSLRDGVELVYRKFSEELQRNGVVAIEAVGKPFDENEHEALMQREADGEAPGTVVAEIQKGYRMGDRVLRHSKVVVAV